MGHCGGFDYALWATAWNEGLVYKSVISALLDIAQDFVIRYGPIRQPTTIAQNPTIFLKLAKFFKAAVRLKSEHI
jgi:hypothetical protein